MKILDLKIKPNLSQPQSANPISQCQIENYKNFLCESNNIRYGFYLELHMCTIIFFFRNKLMVQKMLTWRSEKREMDGVNKFSWYWTFPSVTLHMFLFIPLQTPYDATLFIWPMQCNLQHSSHFAIDCTCEISRAILL